MVNKYNCGDSMTTTTGTSSQQHQSHIGIDPLAMSSDENDETTSNSKGQVNLHASYSFSISCF